MSRHMHHKIICQKSVLTPSAAGQHRESWQDIASVWAAVAVLSRDRNRDAGQDHLVGRYRLRTRYQADLLATRHIIWQGVGYRVEGMIRPDARNRVLEFTVREVFGS